MNKALDRLKRRPHHVVLALTIVLLLAYQAFCWWQDAAPMVAAGENPLHFLDYFWRWQECAYFVRGHNPFDSIHGTLLIEEIGAVPAFAGTVPWAYVLGNVINPGFLPYRVAEVYGRVLYVALPLFTAWVVYRWLQRSYLQGDKSYAVLLAISIFLPICWRQGLTFGNHSVITSCLIILTMCLVDKYPVLCGVLMAVASIKPQSTGLFLLVLLLMRKYKTILVAAGGLLAAWVASFVVTGTAPLEMTLQMMRQGAGYEIYMGLFDFLKGRLGTPVVLVINAVSGVAYTALFWFWAKSKGLDSVLALFSGAALASSFWFYRQAHDLIVLAIPGLWLYLIFRETKFTAWAAVWTTAIAVLLYALPFSATPLLTTAAGQWVLMLVGRISTRLWDFSVWYTLERLLVAAAGVWLLYCCKRLAEEKRSA